MYLCPKLSHLKFWVNFLGEKVRLIREYTRYTFNLLFAELRSTLFWQSKDKTGDEKDMYEELLTHAELQGNINKINCELTGYYFQTVFVADFSRSNKKRETVAHFFELFLTFLFSVLSEQRQGERLLRPASELASFSLPLQLLNIFTNKFSACQSRTPLSISHRTYLGNNQPSQSDTEDLVL